MSLKFIKPEKALLAIPPEYRERWCRIESRKTHQFSVLAILCSKTRSGPPHGERLDLLFQDAESNTRYEVELVLGSGVAQCAGGDGFAVLRLSSTTQTGEAAWQSSGV